MAFLKTLFVWMIGLVFLAITLLVITMRYSDVLKSSTVYQGSNIATGRFNRNILRDPLEYTDPRKKDDTNVRQNGFRSESRYTTSNFGAYCSLYSDAHEKLPWPDEPNDWTDWTYTKRRSCSKIEFPNNQTTANRTKVSLYCDKNSTKLVHSFTNSSTDVQVIRLKSSCLSTFINDCCNDDRGLPNIVHYVWYFQKEMPLYMFTSMLSVIRFLRPCLILFHGEFLPYGKYWDYIINIYPNILHVKRPRPLEIFGVKIKYHAHSGDIMRLEALIQLGGIYMDTDFIVLRDLEQLRQYDVTMCYQSNHYLHSSFIMAKKNATFIHLWMDGYRKDYRNTSYTYNAMKYNRDLAYKHQNLIHIEEGTLCCPAFLYRKSTDPEILYNWSALYGYHISARDKALRNVTMDLDWMDSFNTTLGSMLRYVVYGNKELCF